MKIIKIIYNWHQWCHDNKSGDDYQIYSIGAKGVVKIEEFVPSGIMAQSYFIITFENGNKEKIYNPNQVFYEPSPTGFIEVNI